MVKQYRYPVVSVFATAVQFVLAAQQIKNNNPPLAFPIFTNVSLSIELMFKTLMLMDGRPFPGEHNLYKLFHDLNDTDKAEIRTVWEVFISTDSQKKIQEFLRSEGQPSMTDLDDCLSSAANSFVEFRYGYEKKWKPYNLDGFHVLLMEMILRRDPALKRAFPSIKPIEQRLPGLPRNPKR